MKDNALVWKVLENYIPAILIKRLGRDAIMKTLDAEELQPYRDAILTKKISSMAFYRFGADWKAFSEKMNADFAEGIKTIASAME